MCVPMANSDSQLVHVNMKIMLSQHWKRHAICYYYFLFLSANLYKNCAKLVKKERFFHMFSEKK